MTDEADPWDEDEWRKANPPLLSRTGGDGSARAMTAHDAVREQLSVIMRRIGAYEPGRVELDEATRLILDAAFCRCYSGDGMLFTSDCSIHGEPHGADMPQAEDDLPCPQRWGQCEVCGGKDVHR